MSEGGVTFVIVKPNNGKFYYFERLNEHGVVWNGNVKQARAFCTQGQAEYYAQKKNLSGIAIRKILYIAE